LFPYTYTNKDKYEEKNENTVIMVDKKRKYNIASLHNESTKLLYQQRLNDKLTQNEFADTEEMSKYLKIVFMKQQKKLWEKNRLTKEGKHFFGMQKQKKKDKIKNNYFLNGLVQRTIMTKYNTKEHKQK
jgi:hypothetical protein